MSCVPEYDFCRVRGDTFPFQLTLTDGTNPLDISGSSFRLAVNTLEDPPDVSTQLFELTGTITDGPGGVVEFQPTLANADQAPETYYYDVQWTNADGDVRTILKGQWVVEQDRTK